MPNHTTRHGAGIDALAVKRAGDDGGLRGLHGLGGADVHPYPFEPQSAERPASAARSNSGDIDNGPGGAPAKNAGVSIAAPA